MKELQQIQILFIVCVLPFYHGNVDVAKLVY